ncbi:MAG: galactose mutarotase [Bacteroidetes bacterium]|nr:galactose mutarotase [Bacteroidota bacterium]
MLSTEVCEYVLSRGSVRVGILDLGATLSFLEMPDRKGQVKNIVAGFPHRELYWQNDYYFGCIVGRYANRIGEGRLQLDGRVVQLSVNNDGNHLHGGFEGLHRKRWRPQSLIERDDASGIVLEYMSPDGEEGYPGNLRIQVSYVLDGAGRLYMDYIAVSDAATPVSLTNHSYFNLSGFENPVIDDHLLRIFASRYTEKNGANLPTGRLLPVKGTPLDFTALRSIGERIGQLSRDQGYDHNYVLDGSLAGELSVAAELYDPDSGRQLRILTDRPGIQVYTANWWDGSVVGSQGVPYGRHGAIALETQAFPDSPNQPGFPDTILRPGEVYRTTTIFQMNTK